MEGDPFQILNGISPWWWVAFAFALGAVEVLTFSFFLLWPGFAALAVAILLWMFPGMSGTGQLLWFALLSIAFTAAGRYVVMTRKPGSDRPNLNQRSAALIGRNAVVVDGFAAGGLGNVTVDGVVWRGRLSEGDARPAPGDLLDVVDADGMTLTLKAMPER